MKKFMILFLVLAVMSIVACTSDPSVEPSLVDPSTGSAGVVIEEMIFVENVHNVESDDYHINEVTFDGVSTLEFDLSWSGGCEVHELTTYVGNTFMESAPPQVNLRVIHDDPNDPCDGIMNEQINVDLTYLIERSALAYGGRNTFIVNVLGADAKLFKNVVVDVP